MKIINFKVKRNLLNQNYVNGNLALKRENQEMKLKEYEKPVVKKLVLVPSGKQDKDTRIFMGCYTYSWSANDGDGC